MHAMDGHANTGIQTAVTDTAMGQVTASCMFAICVLCGRGTGVFNVTIELVMVHPVIYHSTIHFLHFLKLHSTSVSSLINVSLNFILASLFKITFWQEELMTESLHGHLKGKLSHFILILCLHNAKQVTDSIRLCLYSMEWEQLRQ